MSVSPVVYVRASRWSSGWSLDLHYEVLHADKSFYGLNSGMGQVSERGLVYIFPGEELPISGNKVSERKKLWIGSAQTILKFEPDKPVENYANF